jgi:uncharacterized protein YbjT (DUF2867 family)
MAETDGPILLTGASGKTGRRCHAKLVEAGAAVRVLVRRQAAADELITAGAQEAVVGDMFDTDVVRRAMEGASAILHICPPMDEREADLACRMTDMAADAGVERLVLYSVLHPFVEVPHHRRKLTAEHHLIESGLPYTILQPGRYMEHLRPIWPEVLRDGVHRMPFSVDARFSLVDIDDLASAAALVLTQPGHEHATYQLAGPEALSQTDCADIIGEVLGRSIRAEARPLDQFIAKARAGGMSETRLNVMRMMNHHYDSHGLRGNSNVLQWLIGRAPRTFRQFVETLPV